MDTHQPPGDVSPDPSAESVAPARTRRHTLTLVRWGMILLCAVLLVDRPASAAILAPLLVVAILLGSRFVREQILGWYAPVDESEHDRDVPRRKV